MPFPAAPQLSPLSESDFREIGLSKVSALLNDRSMVGAVYNLIAAQAAQLANYGGGLNGLPQQIIQQWLAVAGAARIPAGRALVPVVISLTNRFPDHKTIPVGFTASVGLLRFELIEDLILAPGVVSSEGATVLMQAVEAGTQGNLEPGATWTINTPLSFVGSVSNVERGYGGRPLETEDELIDRAIALIRGSALISDDDFEKAARNFFGGAGAALCIPLLGSDRATKEIGAVHVFCLNAAGQVPTQAELNELASVLSRDAVLRIAYVSAMDVVPVRLSVIADLAPGFDQVAVGQAIRDRMIAYLAPGNLPPGESVYNNELEFQVRAVQGLLRVKSVSVATGSDILRRLDLQLPYAYSTTRLESISVTLVLGSESYSYSFEGL